MTPSEPLWRIKPETQTPRRVQWADSESEQRAEHVYVTCVTRDVEPVTCRYLNSVRLSLSAKILWPNPVANPVASPLRFPPLNAASPTRLISRALNILVAFSSRALGST